MTGLIRQFSRRSDAIDIHSNSRRAASARSDVVRRFSLCALGCGLFATAWAAEPPEPTVITHGQFIDSPSTTPPGDNSGWEQVILPDLWAVTRPKFQLNGWYRFNVRVDSWPKEGYGLYIETVRTQTELYVNGAYAGASGVIDGPAPDRVGFSQLFVVPTAQLHEGDNVMHLRVFRPGAGGGLSEITFAGYSDLYLSWLTRLFYNYASYAFVGVTITTIGVFILVLWFQQRHAEYLYFGAGALMWGLHSLFRLLPGQRFPLHFTTIWHFSNLLSVALLTIFCLRFAQRRWRVFERIVWVCAIALLPVFYISTWFGTAYLGYLPEVTEFTHQIFNVFIVVALVAVMLRVKEDGGFESWLLLLGALSFSGPRLIAWVGVNDRTTLDPLSLTPPSILAFVFIAGWILIERFVRTAREFETLNAQLELRVVEKSRELHAQLSATETAREEAERANLAKSRFLAAASHDLRQPLHALGLFASALNEKSHDPESRNLVAHINQSIGALGTLFNSVLDVSKLDARAVSPNIRNIELQRIFERIGDELWPDAGSKQL
ncbi:MAG: histidine kinase dimerization/phospho-acceptor domain-containing protein, partial [Casimicrobiaceae bacterium]